MDESDVTDVIESTMATVRSCAAMAAAGAPIPSDLHVLLIQFNTAVINTLAAAEGSTPRGIMSAWFKVAPADEEWRATTLVAMKAAGEKFMGLEPGDDAA